MMTWTDKKSGKIHLSVQNNNIKTGSWRVFVSLQHVGTRIRLVSESDDEKAAFLNALKENLAQKAEIAAQKKAEAEEVERIRLRKEEADRQEKERKDKEAIAET